MFRLKSFSIVVAVVATLLGICTTAAQAAMTVQPVVLDLKMAGRQMGGQIRVENTGTAPLPVEILLVEAQILPDAVKASDHKTDDLISIPPQAIIPPGATQTFRIQYVGDPEANKSRHYYAEVSQLPVEIPGGQSTIQVLYNFQAMVNVASVTATPAKLSVQAATIVPPAKPEAKPRIAFTVSNAGQNYGYISNGSITVTQRNAAGKEVLHRTLSNSDVQQMIGFGLVAPETTRQFMVPIDLESAEGTAQVTMSGQPK